MQLAGGAGFADFVRLRRLCDHFVEQLFLHLLSGFESDGLVSTECYYEMVEKLTEYGVPFSARLFENTAHGDMWKTTPSSWIVNEILEYAALYL